MSTLYQQEPEKVAVALREDSVPSKFSYIDGLRGYAVLLVIISHVGGAFPELPWPIRAVTNFGFFGVQLFFVVSCFTLMKSWQSRRRRDAAPLSSFFIRRLFRILPMYALAAILYAVLAPPGNNFSWRVLITTMSFTNGWSPNLLGTSDGAWVVVPGGWSITTEFSFYLLFPVATSLLKTLSRTIIVLIFSLFLALTTNHIAVAIWIEDCGPRATDQFIYYWLPNQLTVFVIGFVGFHLVTLIGQHHAATVMLRRWRVPAVLTLVVIAIWFSFLALPRNVTLAWPFLPSHVLASTLFLVLLCVFSVRGRTLLINPAVEWLGRVSFSAYLLHFAVIAGLVTALPSGFSVNTSGVHAIIRFSLLLALTVGATFVVSLASYLCIEQPMVRFGGWLCDCINARAWQGSCRTNHAASK